MYSRMAAYGVTATRCYDAVAVGSATLAQAQQAGSMGAKNLFTSEIAVYQARKPIVSGFTMLSASISMNFMLMAASAPAVLMGIRLPVLGTSLGYSIYASPNAANNLASWLATASINSTILALQSSPALLAWTVSNEISLGVKSGLTATTDEAGVTTWAGSYTPGWANMCVEDPLGKAPAWHPLSRTASRRAAPPPNALHSPSVLHRLQARMA